MALSGNINNLNRLLINITESETTFRDIKGFKQIEIPENLWGKFYTKGRLPKAIQNLWKEVIEWVENSEYEIAANYDFECYSEGDSDSDDYVSGIWVALKLK